MLWLGCSDRQRIHERAWDYDVGDISTSPIRDWEICMEKEHDVSDETLGYKLRGQNKSARMSRSVNVVSIVNIL